MNANHVRPMLAFWLVAAGAAVVTSLGLSGGGASVTVPPASPAPVRVADSSQLVLGGTLQAVSAGRAAPAVAWPSVTDLQYAARYRGHPSTRVREATPVSTAKISGTATTTRAVSAPTARPVSPLHLAAPSTAVTVRPAAPGHGNGHAYGHGSAARSHGTSAPGHGHGHGRSGH